MEQIENAMSRLVIKRPFYGSTALRLKLVEDNMQPTAYTDGKVLGYNRYFVEKLSRDEVQFLVCHEVLHVVLKHPWRREGREPGLFNEACDFVINLICKDDGFRMIPNILLDEKYRDMSSEYVYSQLLKDRKEEDDDSSSESSSEDGDKSDDADDAGGGGGTGDGGEYGADDVPSFEEAMKSGQLGDVRDCTDDDGKSDTKCEAEWETAITAAIAQERDGRGTMSGNALAAIKGRNEAYVDWREALANFMSDAGNNFDITWARPNRRFIDNGDYFSSMKREGISDLVIAVDTSGSVSDREIKQFCSETLEIADQFDCKITFIPCDSRIGKVQEFESGDYPSEVDGFRIGGRAGTEFQPPFDWVEANMDDAPTAMIYMTAGDMAASCYPDEPNYPVLWAISTRRRWVAAPWGQSLEVVV